MLNEEQGKVPVGFTTALGVAVALLGLIPIAAKVVQEGSAVTVNGPEKWLALIGIGLGGIVAIGRYLQASQAIAKNVKVGATTVVSVALGLLGLLPIIVKSYEEGAQALHSPERYAAIAGVVALAASAIGRYLQSLPVAPGDRLAIAQARAGVRPPGDV